MPKTKVYEPEFKKKIVQLYLEQGYTIKSLNEEYQLGDRTVRKWVRAFREECETDPDLNDTKNLYEENHKLRRELEEKKKEIALSQVYTFLTACAVYLRGRKSGWKTHYFHALGFVV